MAVGNGNRPNSIRFDSLAPIINGIKDAEIREQVIKAIGLVTGNLIEEPDPDKWRLMSVAELRERPQATFLLPDEEVLVAGATNTLIGETMTFKSFLALDWGLKVAKNGGKVVYLLNEAAETFPGRFDAWRKYHNVPEEALDEVHVFDGDFNLVNHAEDIATMCQGAHLVVIDTLRRSIKGFAEDSADEVTEVIAACDLITRETGAAVLLVAHTGHENKKRIRGSSVWAQAVHHGVALEKTDNDGVVRMTNEKAKSRKWAPRSMKLHVTGPGPDDAVLIPTENRFSGLKVRNQQDHQAQLYSVVGDEKFAAARAARIWGLTEERSRAILREGSPLRYEQLSEGKKGMPAMYRCKSPKESAIFEK